MNIEQLKQKQNTMNFLVIFTTKSLGIEILNNGAVTAPFHDPSFIKIQTERIFSATNS